MISYNPKTMTLSIKVGSFYRAFQCPFGSWWRSRKYFRRPKLKWYFGPMWKHRGKKNTQFGEYEDYEYQGGYWPMASTEYLKWHTPKWFPIHIMSWDIGWKDKWDTPRYERPGYFIIFFGRNYKTCWQFSMVVKAPEAFCANDCTKPSNDDNYWESMLWYLNYSDVYNSEENKCDIVKARNSLQGEWTTDDFIPIGYDTDIVSCGREKVSAGKNKEDFTYVEIKRNISDTDIPSSLYTAYLNTNVRARITVFGKPIKDSKAPMETICKYSSYVHITIDDECDNATIRMYFKDDDKLMYNIIKKQQYGGVKFQYIRTISLGPTFKDEFLTKKGIKAIRESVKD